MCSLLAATAFQFRACRFVGVESPMYSSSQPKGEWRLAKSVYRTRLPRQSLRMSQAFALETGLVRAQACLLRSSNTVTEAMPYPLSLLVFPGATLLQGNGGSQGGKH